MRRGDDDTAQTPGPTPAPVMGPVRAVVTAFVVVAFVNAAVLMAGEAPVQGLRIRGLHHLYQGGRLLGVGLLVAGLVAATARARALGRRRGLWVLGALALLTGVAVLAEDLSNFADNTLPSAPRLALGALIAAAAVSVVAAAVVGGLLGRPRWRWLAVLVGVLALGVHPFVLETGYPGVHLFVVACAVALIAGALAGARLPRVWPRLVAALPWTLTALVAAFTLVVPPSNSLQLQMLQQEGDVVTPFLSRLRSLAGDGEGAVPKAWRPWFARRDEHAPIPASKPPLLSPAAGQPIVILLTIDSLRADVLASKKHDKSLPNLAALRDASLDFTQARAPGSQTAYTIAEFFSGKYFSQLYWTENDTHRDRWPDDDPTPRFPQVLTDAGVPTVNYATTKWLDNATGIVRGFSEDNYVPPKKTRYTVSAQTFPLLIERLAAAGEGPLFAYTHLLDAHYTVSPLQPKSPAKKKYLANLKLVDDSIGELRAAIERLGLQDRVFILISSDHGEAFGEHNTHHHRYTVYEELLRVPLLIYGPGVKPRKIDAPVSVMDIGPTVLDIFGQPTPGHFMGESLAGFMRGGNPKLTRPIAAEGRLKKVLVFPDELKAIVDDRHGTSEVYNLKSDPGELINLLDADDPKAAERIAAVRRFFELHEYKQEGYETPFRP